MRLATVRRGDGTAAARVSEDGLLHFLDFPDVKTLLESGPDWQSRALGGATETAPVEGADFGPLVADPEKVLCIGLNYVDHAKEAGLDLPAFPMVFGKYARSITGPFDDIGIPTTSDQVDWEVELGVVMGREVSGISVEQAPSAIAGYTIINDVSMRDWQMRTSQVTQGKIFEAATPVGPFLVTPDELPEPLTLSISCHLDGEPMQDGSTADLIFSPFELVAYLSEILTLVPGDLIATGTPAGIGLAKDPPRFIRDGETLRSVVEGLGEQRNLFRATARGGR